VRQYGLAIRQHLIALREFIPCSAHRVDDDLPDLTIGAPYPVRLPIVNDVSDGGAASLVDGTRTSGSGSIRQHEIVEVSKGPKVSRCIDSGRRLLGPAGVGVSVMRAWTSAEGDRMGKPGSGRGPVYAPAYPRTVTGWAIAIKNNRARPPVSWSGAIAWPGTESNRRHADFQSVSLGHCTRCARSARCTTRCALGALVDANPSTAPSTKGALGGHDGSRELKSDHASAISWLGTILWNVRALLNRGA
jgi:hypothetical protein